jgi:hypothetical protein
VSAPYLQTLALDLLAVAEAALAEDRTGHPIPPRRYVHFGEPAWDLCTGDTSTEDGGQLVVWVGGITTEVVQRGTTCGIEHRGQFCVEVARCFPSLTADGQPAAPETLEDAAEVLHRDWWSLQRAVGSWLATLSCSWRAMETSQASGPEGGMAGVRICVRLSLNDTEPFDGGGS